MRHPAPVVRLRFNPRARVGRDRHTARCVDSGHNVSIHAPAWGATRPDGQNAPGRLVSIHAPAWGATAWNVAAMRSNVGFNPRARVGRDGMPSRHTRAFCLFQSTRPRGARRGNPDRTGGPDSVSIHAPAWGATEAPLPPLSGTRCFNPRARVGRDTSAGKISALFQVFQSTRPRGARLAIQRVVVYLPIVSIHAPAWGATSNRSVLL